jgi:hypothetical protein
MTILFKFLLPKKIVFNGVSYVRRIKYKTVRHWFWYSKLKKTDPENMHPNVLGHKFFKNRSKRKGIIDIMRWVKKGKYKAAQIKHVHSEQHLKMDRQE